MSKGITFFILGGTGDLARKKLLPALSNLYKGGEILHLERVYSLARAESTEWETIACSLDEGLGKLCHFIPFDVKDASSYRRLEEVLSKTRGELVFYLSISPFLFEDAVRHLGPMLRKYTNPRKIVIEKPFGFDLASAKRLNDLLHRYFIEDEIYRIDHFLGKETVQNIFSLRFSNTIFEGIWNKNFIDHVQIVALEDTGIEGRAGYYDRVGAIRDMLQNHLLQMLSFLAMEPPCCMEAEFIRDEKVKLLRSIRRLSPEEVRSKVVKARYEGYLHEEGVAKDSKTETFVAVELLIDNPRWQGVPFYLMTGKKLSKKLTQITVVFKDVPRMFTSLLDCQPKQNKVVFQSAPRSKMSIFIELRPPAGRFLACPIETEIGFDFEEYYKIKLPDAYETLLLDVVHGDRSLFIRGDEVELMWEVVQPLLETELPLYIYPQGVDVPAPALELLQRSSRRWNL